MEVQELEVQRRWKTGKGVARKLRAQGAIPAICYRKGIEPIPLSMERRVLEKVLKTAAGQNVLIQLKIQDGSASPGQEMVILKEAQRDHLDRIVHADFMGILMDEAITVEVNLRLVGEPTEALREGGMIQQLRRSVEVECLPADIPEHIEVDVSKLQMGESIHVRDIQVAEGVEILTDPAETVVVISAPEEEAVTEVEGEEAEEGAEEEKGEGEEKKEGEAGE